MTDLDKVLDALSDDERAVIDLYASEYMQGIKDSAFRKAWMDLRLTDDKDQRDFMESDVFTECLHQHQTDTAYWFALHLRKKEIQSSRDEAAYLHRYDEVA